MKYLKWAIRFPVMLIGLPFALVITLVDIIISSLPDEDLENKFYFIFSESYWRCWKL